VPMTSRPPPFHIGFPPPLLGFEPRRLAVSRDEGDWLVMDKPTGVLVLEDNWYPKTPVLTEAVLHQARSEKPELVRNAIGPEGLFAVYNLEPEVAGPVVLTRDPATGEAMRNAFGSARWRFRFELIARAQTGERELLCNLPLARHREKPVMVVSHQTGKKTATQFRRKEDFGDWSLWEAETDYHRFHQIRVHAAESGLKIPGDTVYGHEPLLYFSRLKRGFRNSQTREERPMYDGPALCLKEVELEGGLFLRASDEKGWESCLKRLRRQAGGKS